MVLEAHGEGDPDAKTSADSEAAGEVLNQVLIMHYSGGKSNKKLSGSL